MPSCLQSVLVNFEIIQTIIIITSMIVERRQKPIIIGQASGACFFTATHIGYAQRCCESSSHRSFSSWFHLLHSNNPTKSNLSIINTVVQHGISVLFVRLFLRCSPRVPSQPLPLSSWVPVCYHSFLLLPRPISFWRPCPYFLPCARHPPRLSVQVQFCWICHAYGLR